MAEFEEELSNEEKLKIAQHYLLTCPPGQFQEVLSDVKKLVPEEVLPDNVVAGIARVSNIKSCKLVTAPSGKKVIVSTAGEIDLTHYYDPIDDVSFELDHLTLQTTASDVESNQEEQFRDIRAGLQRRLNEYVKYYYSHHGENASVGVFAVNGGLAIAITGEKINLKNFWSGKFTSTWNLTMDEHGSATFNGDIKIHVHYFEDGNLQMQTHKAVPATNIAWNQNETTLFDKVAAIIQTQESALQNGLEEMYTNMNNETFRSMRRIMPITRTKMDWNVNSVRMVRQVRKIKLRTLGCSFFDIS